MTTQIFNSIRSIVSLNETEEKAFEKILELKDIKKKAYLLQEGEVCNHVYFINTGCFRLFYNVDGVENTVQFFFANMWYTDYASFLTGQQTHENVQALESCSVVRVEKQKLQALYNQYPVFDRVGRIFAENAFLSVSLLNKMLKNEEPQQRYINLLRQRPEIVAKIPQHYIASYLGIKPESLSRIRKRILNSK
jgi:CRP/FNR family transcriptional regulator, anaerobic regulatory protein